MRFDIEAGWLRSSVDSHSCDHVIVESDDSNQDSQEFLGPKTIRIHDYFDWHHEQKTKQITSPQKNPDFFNKKSECLFFCGEYSPTKNMYLVQILDLGGFLPRKQSLQDPQPTSPASLSNRPRLSTPWKGRDGVDREFPKSGAQERIPMIPIQRKRIRF